MHNFLAYDYLGFAYMPDLFETLRKNGETILDEAKTWAADLIVMGTHGRRGISHLALGSDAELVVRESTVPVLLVRARS
jgi:Universal stress protein UspA and related nucleotide-binding proteins